MKKQISLIILVFILGHFSCNKSSCDGERLKSPPYYDIKGLRNDISRITRNSVKPVENDTIAYHNLSLRINAEANYYFTKRNSINFGNLAFACEPQPNGYLGTKEMLEDLIIAAISTSTIFIQKDRTSKICLVYWMIIKIFRLQNI